jgi:hypothetical protein
VHLHESIDIESIALNDETRTSIVKLVELVFGIVIKSEEAAYYISKIVQMD